MLDRDTERDQTRRAKERTNCLTHTDPAYRTLLCKPDGCQSKKAGRGGGASSQENLQLRYSALHCLKGAEGFVLFRRGGFEARHLQPTIATGSFPNGLLHLGKRGNTGSG